eukprot:TRINITY_DN10710_c0_g1_i2.p1 TRINITY_DN10710_c0_g1~~TRINITY_DN10710_c0_g1_i2.p1  ORF type:complete len:400 (+),score=41.19 TRINITY_DN10710_c0_g1_i2:91-1290(+)
MALVVTFSVMFGVLTACGFPSYRLRVPNGHRVPCPPEAIGCLPGSYIQGQPNSTCNGIGHATCKGGSLPLNSFGQSMQRAGYQWTKELCEEDSDGDGQSNGEELGDPCCKWTEGTAATKYMKEMTPSHPGNASHTQSANYTPPICDAATVPEVVQHMAAFNEGEEQRSIVYRVKNYSIPSVRTTYVDMGFNFDDNDQDIFHIVFATVILDQKKHLHHFVLTGCSQKIPEGEVGMPRDAGPHSSCTEPLGGTAFWAPGMVMFSQPSDSGVPIGAGVNIVGFNVNVHYTDGDSFPGAVSQDGFTLYYTPTLRAKTAFATSILQIGQNPSIEIPAGKKRFFVTRSCTVRSVRPLPVIGALFHAHLLGTEMYQEAIRDGQTFDLGSQPIWYYNDQSFFSFDVA